MPSLLPGPAKTVADEARTRAASRRRAAIEADVASLDAQVGALMSDRSIDREKLEESHTEMRSLRMELSEIRRDMSSVRDAVDRLGRELKAQAVDPIFSLRTELAAVTGENATLRAQVSTLSTQMAALQQTQTEQAVQLQDVAVLRAQQGFVQAAADRADAASAEQARVLSELRAELAGLQQRHAALASSAVTEHNAHRQAQGALRSTAETVALQLESLGGEVGNVKSAGAASTEACEKLKKAAKRHELLLHRVSEVHEQRASELRALIKTLADQLRPLHETSRRHAAQIEEVSSCVRPPPRAPSRAHTLSSVLPRRSRALCETCRATRVSRGAQRHQCARRAPALHQPQPHTDARRRAGRRVGTASDVPRCDVSQAAAAPAWHRHASAGTSSTCQMSAQRHLAMC